MTDRYDCIVVGMGGIGSAVLYHLARRGAKVLGLDQHPVAHDKGSSHGETRAIRLVYFEHPDYVPLLKRAFRLWEELDDASETPLFYKTGILQTGPPGGEVMTGLIAAARAHDLPMEQLAAAEVSRRFPGFAAPPDHSAIFDPNGGVLRVEDCIRAHVRMAVACGAVTSFNEPLRHWYVSKQGVTVETSEERYTAGRLVIVPGPWAPKLLPKFSPYLRLLRKSLFWFATEDDCYLQSDGCPAFLFEQGNHVFYGFPAMDEKGVKVADHAGGIALDAPEKLDRHVRTDELEAVSLMLRHNLPRAGLQLNHHTTCMYTMSSDGHFIVGTYPGVPEVGVVAGLSGHGFKFAPVLGEVMADLALEGETAHPIEFLSPMRLTGMR